MITHRFLLALVLFSGLFSSSHAQSTLADQGRYWRTLFGIERWEMDLDHDGDGQSTRGEYFAGTNPNDPASKLKMSISEEIPLLFLDWQSQLDARYQMLDSEDLMDFAPLNAPMMGTGDPMRFQVDPDEPGASDSRFFSLDVLAPLDTDGDGLSDREEAILGTNPELKNTDGDSYDDGAEVFSTFTDPLVFDPAGGTIRGSLRLVGSLTATFESGDPLAEKTVFIDKNFNGILDEGERRTLTDASGAYEFLDLPPELYEVRQLLESGETQTLPAEQTPQLPDRLADEIVNYTHPASGAALDVAYGWAPREVWPGAEGFVVLGRNVEAIDPALLLLPIGVRGENPPLGSYATSHHISLPETASVTVRFDETIIDKEGPDFVIAIPRQMVGGGAGLAAAEPALIAFGPSEEELFEIEINALFPAGTTIVNGVDLADFPQIPFVKVIRVTSQTSGVVATQNTDGGFGLAGFEALNVLPLNSEGRRIRILGTEVFENENFARYFQDLPPSLFLSSGSLNAQAGQPFSFRLIAVDDIGVTSLNATANGAAITLTSENYGTVTPGFPGELIITATVTDTSGQSTERRWTHYVLDENGNLPYDPEVLAEQQGVGLIRIQVFTPNSGDVPAEDVPIIASIVAPTGQTPNWSISYAPINLIAPLNLAAADPDYVPLGSGTANVFSSPLATFPTESLADGIYFLKIEAIPAGGGLGNFYGQVIGVGIDPATIRPQIEITSPTDGANSDLVQDITGSIISTRPITSWEVAYAPLEEVDLSNLGRGEAWKTIASGTETVADSLLDSLDTSLLTNGSYIIRVTAFNDLRLGRVEGIQIEVTSPAKPGRTRRLFTDLALDLHSLPIKIDRVYDSLNRERVGDFGNAWCLDIADANILETVPDTGLNLFGATPYRQGTRIYLNAPDGQRVGFTFEAEFGNASLLGNIYRAKFIPDTGNPYTLETPEGSDPFLNVNSNGEISLTFIGLPWNPDRFILTNMAGISYSYHEDQGLTGIEDRNGNTLEYSKSGITHSAGPAVVFERDAEGRITTVTGPGGEDWTYEYSAAGDLISVTDPGGSTTTFDYDPVNPHFLTSVTDPFGRMGIRFEYDEDGRLAAVIDEFGNREEQTWDPAALTGTITDRNNNTTSLLYDDRGNVLTSTDQLGNVTTFKYEDARHPDTETEIITANTRIRHVLNEMGLPIQTRYGDGFFSDFSPTYNERGQVTQRDNFGGQREIFSYDDKGNLLSRRGILVYPFETYTYTPQGQVASKTINNQTLETFYDPNSGMKIRETGPLSFNRAFAYSPDGRISTITDGRGETVTFDFMDALDKVAITLPGNAVQTVAFDASGDLVRTDPNGNVAKLELAYNDAELSRTLEDGNMVGREFDPGGNLTKLTVPGGHADTFGYDALNRRISFTDSAGETATTIYDAEGRVVSHTNRNGKKISYTYNRFSLVETESWHAADDSIERIFTYTYGGTLLTSVTDGTSKWTFLGGQFYGQPSDLIYEFEGQAKFNLGINWTLHRDDQIPTRIRLNDSADVFVDSDFRADFIGDRVVGMKYNMSDYPSGSVQLRFDPDGRTTEIGRFDFFSTSVYNAVPVSRTRRSYDRVGNLASIRHEKGDGSLTFPEGDLNFARDPGGRISTLTRPGNVASYTYDTTDQITTVTQSAYADETYTYDVAGNPTSATTGADNRLLTFDGLTLTYDPEGNLASQTDDVTGEVRTFSYDHRNQLIAVTSNSVTIAEYKYDYRGRMMSRIENGQKTWILHERNVPHAEFADGASEVNRVYLYNFDRPEETYGIWTPADGIRWHLTDQIGSVQGVVGPDGAGLHWLDYDTFGTPRSAVPVGFGPLRFAGRYFNEAAGLYENSVRHYNPRLRRFQQQDPIRHESLDFNYYRYAENNPLSKIDPLGTSAAFEYGLLLKSLADCAKASYAAGECVSQILNAAAIGLQGKTTTVDAGCVLTSGFGVGTDCAAAGP